MRLIDFIMESQFLIERDVMNASEIKKWATEQAARIPNAVGKSWYQSQLFNYLINQTTDPQMVQQVTEPTAQTNSNAGTPTASMYAAITMPTNAVRSRAASKRPSESGR